MTRSRGGIRRPRTGVLLVLPAAAVALLLFVVPLALSLVMSFSRWRVLGSPRPGGVANYAGMAGNGLLGGAALFTLQYAVVVLVVLLVVALGLALLVKQPRRGVGLLRTAFFLPAAVGLTASALLFYELYTTGPGDLLGEPATAFLAVVVMMVWRFAGFYMLILLAGLQGIPDDLYEAARLDGAGAWQRLRYVTLPLLRPSLGLCAILVITGALLAFEQFFVLTGGGPDNATVTVVMVVVREAFSFLDLGSAAAISVVLLVALVALNLVQLRWLRREG